MARCARMITVRASAEREMDFFFNMTRMTLRALSLLNYWENSRMRAVRDGASRAGKSRTAQRDANWKHFIVVTILTFSSKWVFPTANFTTLANWPMRNFFKAANIFLMTCSFWSGIRYQGNHVSQYEWQTIAFFWLPSTYPGKRFSV